MDGSLNAGTGIVAVITLLVDLWALITLSRRPAPAFERAGKSKGFWLIAILVGVFVCNIGFFVSLWYLIIVDPKVRSMQQLGGGPGFPGR